VAALPAFRRAPASYDRSFVQAMAGAYLEQTAWTRLRLAAVRDLVEPAPGERVLDLGCAAGAITHFLSTFGCTAVGVDLEPLAVETARSLFPRLRFEVADVRALPFEAAAFDKAVAADLVEHLDGETLAGMLDEVRRVLVAGGTLSLYTPNPRHVIEHLKRHELILARNPTHTGLRTASALEAALRAGGFEVERSEWRASFIPGLRTLESLAGPHTEWLRYRTCIRATSGRAGPSHA
jgi:SAM-dependent methyltransferase